jgi:hypothetical protein
MPQNHMMISDGNGVTCKVQHIRLYNQHAKVLKALIIIFMKDLLISSLMNTYIKAKKKGKD